LSAANRQKWAILGLTAPAYLWLAVTIFLPLSTMFYCSFLDQSPLVPKPSSFTLAQYAAFFTKPFYQDLTYWSLRLGLYVTLFCIVIGYPAAYALAKLIKGRWREAIFLLIILPFWSNALVRVFSWALVLRKGGVLDRMVHFFYAGAPDIDLMFSYSAVVIGLVHSYLPYMILTCYVSLQTIDDSLIDAAQSLGAGMPTVFRRILFPLSLPGVVAGSVLVFVPVIGSFMEPRILGGTKGATLGMAIEEQFMATANWPLGAALSFIMLAIVLFVFALCYPFIRRRLQSV